MSTSGVISSMKGDFSKAVEYLRSELAKLQTGRAQASLFEGIQVESYGAMQPIKNIAQITVQDAKTIVIKPWDKSSLGNMANAIMNSGMGVNPVNNGETLIINLPDLTEERRRDLTKLVGKMSEEAKISIRQARQNALKSVKNMKNDEEINEDEVNRAEKQIQDEIDAVNKEIDEIGKKKEAEIMTV